MLNNYVEDAGECEDEESPILAIAAATVALTPRQYVFLFLPFCLFSRFPQNPITKESLQCAMRMPGHGFNRAPRGFSGLQSVAKFIQRVSNLFGNTTHSEKLRNNPQGPDGLSLGPFRKSPEGLSPSWPLILNKAGPTAQKI